MVNILRGTDLFMNIFLKGKPGAPHIIFGWIIPKKQQTNISSFFLSSLLENVVKKFCELEEISQPVSHINREEELVEIFLLDTVSRDDSGQYSVVLLLKNLTPAHFNIDEGDLVCFSRLEVAKI